MTITNGYASLAEVKAYLSITDAASDLRLESAIEAASRWIDGECGRVFYTSGTTLAPETRYFTPGSSGRVLIDDLVTLATLKTDDDWDGTPETTWTATDYRLSPRNAAVLGEPYTEIVITPFGNYRFPCVPDGVEVSGIWGYQATVPTQIKAACIREAARRFRLGDAPFGVTGSGEMGTQSVQAYDPEVRKDLQRFKLVSVG